MRSNIYQELYDHTQKTINTYKKLILEVEFEIRKHKEAKKNVSPYFSKNTINLYNKFIRELTSDIDSYNNKIKELEETGKRLLIEANKYNDKLRKLEETML